MCKDKNLVTNSTVIDSNVVLGWARSLACSTLALATIIVQVIAGTGLVVLTTVPARAGPFSCDGNIYQVQSGQLRIFDPILSNYVDVGAPNAFYNAVGYNDLDDFAYGAQGQNVIRIEDDGTVSVIFASIGFNPNAGDVDDNNMLWFRRNNTTYVSIDLATGTQTTLSITGSTLTLLDFVFIRDGGTPYIAGVRSGVMQIINLDTGVSTTNAVTGFPSGVNSFGAIWGDSTGRMFAFHNDTGEIFEMFDIFTASPSTELVAQGDPSNNNDGFSCNQAPFPNLPPIAQDDDFSGPVNNNISGDLFVNNGNGIDEDPEGLAITANTTPVSAPSNGNVTINSNGSFIYTPNTNFIGTDTFTYQISDPSGLTATATVTLDITGTIDFSMTKTQVSGPDPVTAAGQVLGYQIALANTGDIPLTGINLVDTFPDGSNGTPVLDSGDSNSNGELDVGETFLYTISYTTTQADLDAAGPLANQASATSTETGATPRTDTATTAVTINPSITVTKTASQDTNVPAGVSITYTYTVTNNGNVTISGINLSDAHNGTGTPPVPANETLSSDATPLGDSTDGGSNGTWDSLAPGDSVMFTASYQVTQQDIDTLQ